MKFINSLKTLFCLYSLHIKSDCDLFILIKVLIALKNRVKEEQCQPVACAFLSERPVESIAHEVTIATIAADGSR